MEASIKMAEQLAPNRRSDRGRMHGLADEGFDAGQARFLKLTAITHQRFSSPLWSGDEVRKAPRDCRDRAGRGALAMVRVRPTRPSMAPLPRTLAWVHRAARSSRSTAEAQLAGQTVTERR
jgi:hypothetical protein